MVDNIITTYQTLDKSFSLCEQILSKITINEFIYDNTINLLPIPVLSYTSPSDTHNFLIHIILLLGEYSSDINALTEQTTKQCLQHFGLIGENEYG